MKTVTLWLLAPILMVLSSTTEANDTRILSAGYGDALLPNVANFVFCAGFAQSTGLGGMPVVFAAPIHVGAGFAGDPNAIDPSLFRVVVGKEKRIVQPVCATLAPAVNAGERRTVLLTGHFGQGGDDGPTAIRVVGDLRTTEGQSLLGAKTRSVSEVNGGPTLVLAEVFDPLSSNITLSAAGQQQRFCPETDTAVVVKLTFSGGVTGPNGAVLADDQNAINAIQVLAVSQNGTRTVLNPFAVRDDDNDNHLDACFGPEATGVEISRVSVDSHVFYAPQNVPGKATTVAIAQ